MPKNYLSEIEGSRLGGSAGETLVLYLTERTMPPVLLVNPRVVGFVAARGVWHLKQWHAPTRRGFYTHALPVLTDDHMVGLTEEDAADYLGA
jgi:hypothetical protein